jgi:hypothetical protein
VKDGVPLAFIAALVLFGIYMSWFAPCSWFQASVITSVPARCIEFRK